MTRCRQFIPFCLALLQAGLLTTLAGGCSSEGDNQTTLLSKAQAETLVLEQVLAGTSDAPVVARMWGAPLQPGDVVSSAFAESDEGRVSSASEWFVWIDDYPYAFFSHPGRYVYVNRTTGAVAVESADEVPTLNGVFLWEDPEDFADQSTWIFDTLSGNWPSARGRSAMAPPRPIDGAAQRGSSVLRQVGQSGEDAAEEACCQGQGHRIGLLLYNFDSGPLRRDISDNVTGMAAALQANGFTVPTFSPSTGSGASAPAIYLGDTSGNGLQQLRDFVAEHSGPEHCCDEIFVYYSGHGKEKTVQGETRYYFGLRFSYRGEDGERSGRRRFYAEDFAEILSGLGSCHIHVLIDACHAGGFMGALTAVEGVETVRVSADADERAWSGAVDGADGGATPDPYARADGELGSEFTSGFVKGLQDHAAQADSADAPTSARDLMDIGFEAAVENDIAAIAEKTHPTGWTRLDETCRCCEDGDASTQPGEDAVSVLDFLDVAMETLDYAVLPSGNTVLHSDGETTTTASGSSDLVGVGAARISLDEQQIDAVFNGEFACGGFDSGAALCSAKAFSAGEYTIIVTEFAEALAVEEADLIHEIAVVFDGDADPENNYQPGSNWPADFFADTDLWIVAAYRRDAGWTLQVSALANSENVNASPVGFIRNGNAVILVVGAAALSSNDALYRVTVFRHDGSYGLEGGFWNGDLSTTIGEPMRSVSAQ